MWKVTSTSTGRTDNAQLNLLRGLPLADSGRCRELFNQYGLTGVERLVRAIRYDTAGEYTRQLERLASLIPAS